MKRIKERLTRTISDFKNWTVAKQFQLILVNIFLIILVLLRSAGYFDPFFPITINIIVLLGIISSIIILRVGSSFVFSCAIFFWILTALFRILKIAPWAERTGIYSYEAMIIGIFLLLIESFKERK